MSKPPEPLPHPLGTTAFAVEHARALGVSAARLRASDLEMPHYGVRHPRSAPSSLWSRAVPLLGARRYFGSTTAAELWGCPLPPDCDSAVHIVDPVRAPEHRGVLGHRASVIDRVVERHGVRVTDAPSTWIALANVLPFQELVVCGDHLVHDPPILDPAEPLRPHTTITALRERMRGYRGRGVRAARAALELLVTGAESRPETLLRLLLLDAGITDFMVNARVDDGQGRFIARCDLVFAAQKVVVEYDGDHHRTSLAQYERDRQRVAALIEAGWAVIDVRARALFGDPLAVVRRVRRALDR